MSCILLLRSQHASPRKLPHITGRRHRSADNADIHELSLIVSFPGAHSCLSPVIPQAAALMAAFPCMTFSEECSTHPHSLLHILFSDILSNPLAAARFKTATMVSAVYWRLCSWFTKRDTRSWLWLYTFLFTVLVWPHPPAITLDVSGRNVSESEAVYVNACLKLELEVTTGLNQNSLHTLKSRCSSITFLQWMTFSTDLRERKWDMIQKKIWCRGTGLAQLRDCSLSRDERDNPQCASSDVRCYNSVIKCDVSP